MTTDEVCSRRWLIERRTPHQSFRSGHRALARAELKGRYELDWREDYKRKLVSAAEAVKVVKSGDRVVIPLLGGVDTLAEALGERKDELRDVEILQGVCGTGYPWYQPGYEEAFTANLAQYTGPIPRQFMWDRRGDFTPVTYAMEFKDVDERRPGYKDPDVVMVKVTPPDSNGFCNFGVDLWEKKEYCKRAKIVLAEVDEKMVRTCGDTYIHCSDVDYFVDATAYDPTPQEMEEVMAAVPPQNREKVQALFDEIKPPPYRIWKMKGAIALFPPETLAGTVMGAGPITDEIISIAHYVSLLINNGDCIQVGTGNTSNPVVRSGLFKEKQDLGFHCETAPPGIPTLVKEGVFTGKYKNIDIGKAVATTYGPGIEWRQDELDYINDNPLFEIRGSHYTNNPGVIAANDNHVSINNALYVDLTGQIGSETTTGFLLYNGPGGQLDWVIGALLSKGGRSVTVMPSTAVGGSISRIVPLLESGVLATIPRTYADFIVTEHGIASLLGKSQRKRADELIAIAHPDHREELKKEAQKLFWP